jgi:gluconokinase
LKLFGRGAVSISMASGTGLFDQNECHWDHELLAVLDLSPEMLLPLHDFSSAMAGLERSYAARWPALAEIPWYLPLGDGACNNIGSGGTSHEWVVVMIGTSGALRVVRAADRVDIPRGLWTYRVDRRRFVQGGAFSNGGNLFAWLEQTFQLDALPRLEQELAAMEPDSHRLAVLPFLAGERSPDWDPNLRAALVGMGLHTTGLNVARASMEAVALRFGLVYEILREIMPKPRGIIGSGTALINSPAWLQIMADVLADPLKVSAVAEATSRGAALLGLEALGVVGDAADLPVPLGAEYAPITAHTETYRAAMRRQERLRDALLPIMHGLSEEAYHAGQSTP